MNSDVSIEGAGGWGDIAHGFCGDGVDVSDIALHRVPVYVDTSDASKVTVWVEFVDQVGLALVEEDAAFVDGEKRAGCFDFFNDDVPGIGGVNYGEVVFFCIAN